MAHYAKVVDGLVTQVIVADDDFFNKFVDTSAGEWIQTSYNTISGKHPEGTPLRKNFAGIGYSYDKNLDAFIPPKPFESWVLNKDTCRWEAPLAKPEGSYQWSEETTSWVVASQE